MFEKAGAGDFTEAMNITTQLVFIRDGLMGWSCAIRWGDTPPFLPPPGCMCVRGRGLMGWGVVRGEGTRTT